MITIHTECENCHHVEQVYHLDWYSVMCTKCNAEIENEFYLEEYEDS